MKTKTVARIAVLVGLGLLVSGAVTLPQAQVPQPETLRVALYPFVPTPRELFHKLEAVFEAEHKGVNLELVERTRTGEPLADSYYSGGLAEVDADIYEIDTVLLPELVESGKLAELTLPFDANRLVPGTAEAVRYGGKTWAIPHWVCGNFLFYRRDDSAVEGAATWEDLRAALGPAGSLLLDLKGKSTLGEWYLTALAAADGDPARILNRLLQAPHPPLDAGAVKILKSVLALCPAGYCRSDDFHYRPGFYARMFARGQVRIYIGYSETMHYALREVAENCGPTSGCLTETQVGVRQLPLGVPQGRPVGWVDGLAISANLSGPKRQLAEKFIELATSWRGYQLVLNPDNGQPPRYLLPALAWRVSDAGLTGRLYEAFDHAFGPRLFLTARGLYTALRDSGKRLDCELPPDRGDIKWEKACRGVPGRP